MIQTLYILLLSIGASQSWDRQQGLPYRINTMISGPTGHLWIGTEVGLFLFDGKDFLTIGGPASHQPISALASFGDTRLICGGAEGLYYYQDGQLILTKDFPTASLCVTGEKVYAGGPMGLLCLDSVNHTWQPIAENAGAVTALVRDENNQLWIGSENGLYRIDAGASTPRIIQEGAISQLLNPTGTLVHVLNDHRSTWDVRVDRPVRNDPLFSVLDKYQVSAINAMAETNSGDLWIGSQNGLYYWAPVTGEFLTLHKEVTTTVCLDKQNNLWAGGDKLWKYSDWGTSSTFDFGARSLHQVQHKIMGGRDQRFFVYDTQSRGLAHYLLPSNLRAISGQSPILIALDSGLFQWDSSAGAEQTETMLELRPLTPNLSSINHIQLESQTSFYLASEQGAFHYQLDDAVLRELPCTTANGSVTQLPLTDIETFSKRRYFASRTGLFYQKDQELVPDNNGGQPLPEHAVNALYAGEDGLWLATHQGLDLKKDIDAAVSHVIDTPPIYCLTGINDKVWLGTASGLIVYNTSTDQILQFGHEHNFLMCDYRTGQLQNNKDGLILYGNETSWGFFEPYRMQTQWRGTLLLTSLSPKGAWPLSIQSTSLGRDERVLASYFGSPYPVDNIWYRLSDEESWRKEPIVLESGSNQLQLRSPIGEETALSIKVARKADIFSGLTTVLLLLAWCVFVWLIAHSFHKMRWSKRQKVLDQEKNQFLATASHELRTPLNGIMGITDALLRHRSDNMDAFQKQRLAFVLSCASRLNRLVDGMLALTEGRHHELELDKQALDPHHQVEMALDLMIPILSNSQKELNFVNLVGVDLPKIWADEDRLQQILLNLLNNALKFTPRGTISVDAEVFKGNSICFQIKDSGIGIDASEAPHIFDTFKQVKGSTTRPFDGAGLGLAIVKELLCRQGGNIWVESELGKGSSFYFTLPLVA